MLLLGTGQGNGRGRERGAHLTTLMDYFKGYRKGIYLLYLLETTILLRSKIPEAT